ncbi:thioredoxin-dependent thiol peroxidase [Leucobacter tardus]|uniref:thioredoxin-dependent peroxiredoxin n=1 Tax=Leucobacter tardus TaxID=501483 RepID=A0A939TLT2_9MICO|nr:peroxiredoxin [Leucobacter tardus]MBO2988738.1 peroxiredoxin [Leucobacter tardus]
MSQVAPELQAGDTPPAFALVDAAGRSVSSADFVGRRTIVYFYPAAFTPGCTTEACDFRDHLGSLASGGYEVIGISGDDQQTLCRFAAEDALDFTLLSDPDHAVAQAWGAWGEKIVGGETRVGPLRATFVLDDDGRVRSAEYRVDAEGHVRRLREQLGV